MGGEAVARLQDDRKQAGGVGEPDAWPTAGRLSFVSCVHPLGVNYSRTLTSTLGDYFGQEGYAELTFSRAGKDLIHNTGKS